MPTGIEIKLANGKMPLTDMRVVGEIAHEIASFRIVYFDFSGPSDTVLRRDDHYWLDLCLTPRPLNVRGGYQEKWGPHRFERIGDLFIVPPGRGLRIRSDQGGEQSSLICELKASAVDQWLDHEVDWTDQRLSAALDLPATFIRNGLQRLAIEARTPGLGSARLIEGLLIQLSIDVARYCEALNEGPVSGGLAAWRLRLIDERLQKLSDPPSLEELAKLCNMSARQLTRGFRTSRGCSIGDYISQFRIETAKRLLGGEQSVQSIAFALGYTSPSAFSLAFRKVTGMSPSVFRQRQLRKMKPL